MQLRGALCQFQQVRDQGDAEILRIAGRQHGHIHRIQLEAAGLGRGALAHRLGTGMLRAIFPSVYQVAGGGGDRLGRQMAAALHFKGDAGVTGLHAAEAWQMLDTTQCPSDREAIHVLLIGRSFHPTPGVCVHRVKTLARQDIRWRNGIPITSPARTLLHLAGVLDDLELEAAASMAFRRSLRAYQLSDVIDRHPRAKGVGRLRTFLDDPGRLRDTRSKWERELLRLIAAAELPGPVTNVMVAGHMVDMLWPDLKLVVEFDGWEEHGKRPSFETDRLRDQDLAAFGHQALRVTYRQIERAPHALVARMASAMTTRRLSR